jgi:hypothetical protein
MLVLKFSKIYILMINKENKLKQVVNREVENFFWPTIRKHKFF